MDTVCKFKNNSLFDNDHTQHQPQTLSFPSCVLYIHTYNKIQTILYNICPSRDSQMGAN